MSNVLKTTLIYTGAYFVFCAAYLLVLVTAQIFWKPIVFMFFMFLAIVTFQHFRGNDPVADFVKCKTQDWMPPSVRELRAAMDASK